MNRPLKVLMTADAIGGVWTYALDLARALQPHGVQVTLATMGALPTERQRSDAASLPNVQLVTSDSKLEWMPEPWEDVARSGEWLLDLEREGADIVHLNGYAHAALPFRAPKLVVAHSCVLSWWQAVKGQTAPMPEWARYKEAVERGLNAADRLIAPTRAMLDALHAQYRFDGAEQVIYNGRDSTTFSPAAKEPLILSAGRLWDDAKNIAALARIAGGLDWPVLVAGDSAHPAGASSEFPGVRMLRRLESAEIAAHMARAAVYCLPARYEPFGLSALEAALSGCALVLGDIPTLREVWGDFASFVDPDDGESLRRTLNKLAGDKERRDEMARRARERAKLFTLERVGDGYMDAYRQMTARRTGDSSCA